MHDMLDNHMQTGLCRLGLAMGILIATALGVVLGGWLTLGPATLSTSPSEAIRLTLPLDMVLAGVAACGFGAFYNAPWRVLWVSILCGVVGHGLRYLCLEHLSVEISTLFGCLAIGVIASAAADRMHLPFSAIAFAGAVPMMPGVFIYQSLAGAMRLSAAGTAADPRSPPQPWRSPSSPCSWWRHGDWTPGRRQACRSGFTPSPHVARLTGRCDHAVPERVLRVDLFSLGYRERYRHVREVVIPEADDHVRPPADAGVDRVLPQEQAEGRIVRGRRHASDAVAGIDVLECDRRAGPLEVLGDRVAQKDADSPYRTLPDASRSPLFAIRSWPAPSATTTTAWPRRSSRCCSAERNASSVNGTSGTRQKFTWLLTSAEYAAMNPESRPISFTSPIPLRAASASAFAADVARRASVTAVSNPNVLCTNEMSLSIVFGTPMTPIFKPRAPLPRRSSVRRAAFRRRRWRRGSRRPGLEVLDHFRRSWGPRDDPRIDPPLSWIRWTDSGSTRPARARSGARAPRSRTGSRDLFDAVMEAEAPDDRADHVVQPRAEPAARHDPARELRRIEEQHLPRPGGLHRGRRCAGVEPGFHPLERGVIEHALVVAGEPDA